MIAARKKQLLAAAAILIAVLALAFISFSGMQKNLVYYWDPQELLARGEAAQKATIRLGGVVQKSSLEWHADTLDLRFIIAMNAENSPYHVAVKATGAPPQMFREGIGVVVEGRYDGRQFLADRVMVKHSNEYRPPQAGERPQELYQTLLKDGNL